MTNLPDRLEAIQNLMGEVLQLQRTRDASDEVVKRVRDIVECSGNITQNSAETHEQVLDAKILAIGSETVRNHVQSFDTNLTAFSSDKYVDGVVSYVEAQSLNGLNWDLLSSETYNKFKKVPQLQFMLGTLKIDPPPPKQKMTQERQKRAMLIEKNSIASVENIEGESEASDEVYKHILKCLVQKYRNNNKAAICYFKFIIDPGDYWRTIENIFHFSFLVRDGKVRMILDDRGLPAIEPVIVKTNTPAKTQQNSQFNFRFSIHEWREAIETFQITSAAISPINN